MKREIRGGTGISHDRRFVLGVLLVYFFFFLLQDWILSLMLTDWNHEVEAKRRKGRAQAGTENTLQNGAKERGSPQKRRKWGIDSLGIIKRKYKIGTAWKEKKKRHPYRVGWWVKASNVSQEGKKLPIIKLGKPNESLLTVNEKVQLILAETIINCPESKKS